VNERRKLLAQHAQETAQRAEQNAALVNDVAKLIMPRLLEEIDARVSKALAQAMATKAKG
jgi:hypothetical protein